MEDLAATDDPVLHDAVGLETKATLADILTSLQQIKDFEHISATNYKEAVKTNTSRETSWVPCGGCTTWRRPTIQRCMTQLGSQQWLMNRARHPSVSEALSFQMWFLVPMRLYHAKEFSS